MFSNKLLLAVLVNMRRNEGMVRLNSFFGKGIG